MQTLKFNTTEKSVDLWSSYPKGTLDKRWENVPTVKVQDGYYEVMQKEDVDEDLSTARTIPVFRCPIANPNMIIEK